MARDTRSIFLGFSQKIATITFYIFVFLASQSLLPICHVPSILFTVAFPLR